MGKTRRNRDQDELLSGRGDRNDRVFAQNSRQDVGWADRDIYVTDSSGAPYVSRSNPDSRSGGHNKPARSRFSTLTRLRRRDKSEVSAFVKYIVFICNIIFWLLGGLLIVVGVWAALQKEITANIFSLSDTFFDPVVVIIIVGCVIFIVGFFGCVGALRENTILLVMYILCLLVILLLLAVASILVFAFKDWLKERIVESGLKNIIPKYRDDIDLENFIDWVQGEWLHCCGLRDRNDWKVNVYFNCSSPGIEACGFPFSCCIPDPEVLLACIYLFVVVQSAIGNRQCGYLGAVNRSSAFIESRVYTKGCIEQGEIWFNKYIMPIVGATVAVAVVLILSIGFALVLRSDINAQKAKWLRNQL